MNNSNESFLKAYKNFENAIRTKGYESVLSYEAELEVKEKQTGKKDDNLTKIRLCRQCRNFLSHESVCFFEASNQMIQFLIDLASSMDNAYLPVKKFIVKTLITEDTKLQEAVAVLLKRGETKEAPVFNKSGALVGYLSHELVCLYLSKNNVTSTTKVKACMGTKTPGKHFVTVPEDVYMEEIYDNKNYIVTNNKGIITGWY
jgi:hypothetical protein